jgi:hypothetical protein
LQSRSSVHSARHTLSPAASTIAAHATSPLASPGRTQLAPGPALVQSRSSLQVAVHRPQMHEPSPSQSAVTSQAASQFELLSVTRGALLEWPQPMARTTSAVAQASLKRSLLT